MYRLADLFVKEISIRSMDSTPDEKSGIQVRIFCLEYNVTRDAGFTVSYNSSSVNVLDSSGHILLKGDRDTHSKLWIFLLSSPLSMNNIIHFSRHADLLFIFSVIITKFNLICGI